MGFPRLPTDQQQVTVNSLIYTYYASDKTWYVEGSDPGSVDPQLYSRARDLTLEVDIVSTYEGHQYNVQYKSVEREINSRIQRIDKLIEEFNLLPESQQRLYQGRLTDLENLKTRTQAVIDQPDIFMVDWPPAPPLTLLS